MYKLCIQSMKWWNEAILSIFVTLTTIYNLKTFKSVSPAWLSPRVQICIPKCSNPGIEPRPLGIAGRFLPTEPQGKPKNTEWVAYPFCSRPSWPRNWTRISWTIGRFFIKWAIREVWLTSNFSKEFYFNTATEGWESIWYYPITLA